MWVLHYQLFILFDDCSRGRLCDLTFGSVPRDHIVFQLSSNMILTLSLYGKKFWNLQTLLFLFWEKSIIYFLLIWKNLFEVNLCQFFHTSEEINSVTDSSQKIISSKNKRFMVSSLVNCLPADSCHFEQSGIKYILVV